MPMHPVQIIALIAIVENTGVDLCNAILKVPLQMAAVQLPLKKIKTFHFNILKTKENSTWVLFKFCLILMNRLAVTLKVVAFIMTTFCLVKCSKPDENVYYQEDNSLNFIDSLTFIEAGSFKLPLDSATAITSSSVNFYESPEKQVRLFSMISSAESFISIFNYDTRQLIGKIPHPLILLDLKLMVLIYLKNFQ